MNSRFLESESSMSQVEFEFLLGRTQGRIQVFVASPIPSPKERKFFSSSARFLP